MVLKMRFCVCDDEPVVANIIKKEIETKIKGTFAEGIDVDIYNNAHDLMCENLYKNYTAVFMDIEMEGVRGDKAVKYFRKSFPEQKIIFVSAYEYMAFETYDVKPVAFVRKSRLEKDMSIAVELLLKELADEDFKLDIKRKDGTAVFESLSNVLYIEILNHLSIVHTHTADGMEETIESRESLRSFRKKLENKGFIMVHKSYFVNMKHIYSISKTELVLVNRKKIPVSKHRLEYVKTVFADYIWRFVR